MKNTYLFLDDIRHPYDAFTYTNETMFLQEKWNIVRDFRQFVKWIRENGLPNFISFDHDLADEHYTPQEYWSDYDKSRTYQEAQNYKEKTGYDCALWLVNYCLDNKLPCPDFYSHSMNPVGKDKINGLLEQFKGQ